MIFTRSSVPDPDDHRYPWSSYVPNQSQQPLNHCLGWSTWWSRAYWHDNLSRKTSAKCFIRTVSARPRAWSGFYKILGSICRSEPDDGWGTCQFTRRSPWYWSWSQRHGLVSVAYYWRDNAGRNVWTSLGLCWPPVTYASSWRKMHSCALP